MSANTPTPRQNPKDSGKKGSSGPKKDQKKKKGNPYEKKERPIHAVANLGTVGDKFFKKKYLANQWLSVAFSGTGDTVEAVFNFSPMSTDGLRLEQPLALGYEDYMRFLSARETALKMSDSQQGWDNLLGKISVRLKLKTDQLRPSQVNYHKSMVILNSFFTQKERELLNSTQKTFASLDPKKVSAFIQQSLKDSGFDWATRVQAFNAMMEGIGELPKFSIVSYDRKQFFANLEFEKQNNPEVKKTSGISVAPAISIAGSGTERLTSALPTEAGHASSVSVAGTVAVPSITEPIKDWAAVSDSPPLEDDRKESPSTTEETKKKTQRRKLGGIGIPGTTAK